MWPLLVHPQDVPYVVEIDSIIKIAGGINTPLIVRTTDDRGHVQRQLCKCNDDLRQVCVPSIPPACQQDISMHAVAIQLQAG